MIKCLECGHDEADHHTGHGPFWPCLVPGCDCCDVIYRQPEHDIWEQEGGQ